MLTICRIKLSLSFLPWEAGGGGWWPSLCLLWVQHNFCNSPLKNRIFARVSLCEGLDFYFGSLIYHYKPTHGLPAFGCPVCAPALTMPLKGARVLKFSGSPKKKDRVFRTGRRGVEGVGGCSVGGWCQHKLPPFTYDTERIKWIVKSLRFRPTKTPKCTFCKQKNRIKGAFSIFGI